ncbi:MAG: pirin family protein [Actinomycetota bacterium]|nr:pirin family protein [Actinomycetota bacterium]
MSTHGSGVREVRRVITAHHQLEGAGFAVFRPFPTEGLDMLDPFLMLDEKEPKVYAPGEAKGAPDHPHRGFETVSYVLDGETEHSDSLGNRGLIGKGDVQWMTAGDGIVHCEMPSQRIRTEGGRTHGFQLWVNLPAELKRTQPRYQSLTAPEIPKVSGDGWEVVVIAGDVLGVSGPARTHTPIVYAHLTVDSGTELSVEIPADHQAGLYLFAGSASVGADRSRVAAHQLAVFAPGDGALTIAAPSDAEEATQALLMAGRPLGEPVARHGPFVMNSHAELIEAVEDYQAGRMGTIAPAGM